MLSLIHIFNQLTSDFVSHTSDLDFYGILNDFLDVSIRSLLAKALNFVALDISYYKEEMKDDECFATSLLVGGHLDSNDMEMCIRDRLWNGFF